MKALDQRLGQQLTFLLEIDRLKTVMRGTPIADVSRKENTAEHSWHLALFASVLAEYAAGPIDVARVVQMVLIHDLVEIDAGDTPLFDQGQPGQQDEDERRAAIRIFGLLPEDQACAFRSLWDEFEAADSDDAKFAKALDRFQPSLLNHVTGGGTWLDYQVDETRERTMASNIELGAPTLWAAAEAIFADAVKQGWLLPPR